MDTFIRPSDRDDRIGRLNQKFFSGLTGQSDDQYLDSFRSNVLGRAKGIEDPEQRQFAIGEMGLVNESRIEQLSSEYGVDPDESREMVADWYNYFAEEHDLDPDNVPHPVERTNKWMAAKLASAQSEKEAEAIKTGGMYDVGRFVGEVAKAPVEVPFRAGVDVGNFLEGDRGAGGALLGTDPSADPVANLRTGSQFLSGLTGVEAEDEANFYDRFDPETGEIVQANRLGATARVAGAGVREVTKALTLASGLGGVGLTEKIGSGAANLATRAAGGSRYANIAGLAAREVAESTPLFIALGAAGRGEAGEGLGDLGDVASDAAQGALFGSISAAFQTLGRMGVLKNLDDTAPELAKLRDSIEKSGGVITDDIRTSLSQIGKLDELGELGIKAVRTAQAIDRTVAAGEVGSQFLAGYLVDRAQGASHEEAAINGILFGALDVARAKGLRVAEAELAPLRRTVRKMVTESPESIVGEMAYADFAARRAEMDGAEMVPDPMQYRAEIEESGGRIQEPEPPREYHAVPEDGEVSNYKGRFVEHPAAPPSRADIKLSDPPEVWIRRKMRELGSAIRVTKALTKGVLGRWFHNDGRSEQRAANDFSVAFHEALGHGIDFQYDVMPKPHELISMDPAEYTPLTKEMFQYFVPDPGDRLSDIIHESYASWTQAYMRDPEGTAARSPLMYQRFVERVPEKVRKTMLRHSEEYRAYLQMPDWQKAMANVVKSGDLGQTLGERFSGMVRDVLGVDDLPGFRTGPMDRFKTAAVDKYNNLLSAVIFKQRAMTGQKYRREFRRGDLRTERLIRQMAGGSGERAELTWTQGIPKAVQNSPDRVEFIEGTEGGWQGKVYDNIPEGMDADAFLDQTAQYMISQRVVEVADNLSRDLDVETDAKRSDLLKKMAKQVDTLKSDLAEFSDKLLKKAKESKDPDALDQAKEIIAHEEAVTQSIIKRVIANFQSKFGNLERSYQKKLEKLQTKSYSGQAPSEQGRGMTDVNFAVETMREIEQMAEDGGYLENLQRAAQGARDMTRGAMLYAVEGGRISREQFDYLVDRNPNYTTMQRVMNLDDTSFRQFADSTTMGLIGRANIFGKAEGSRRPIKNPMETMPEKVNFLMAETDKNRVLQEFTDGLSPDHGRKDIVHPEVLNTIAQKLHTAYFDPETGTYKSKKSFKPSSTDNIITVFRMTKFGHAKETWHVPDHGLWRTINGMGESTHINKMWRLASIPQQIAKWSITHGPWYALRNVTRDVTQGQIVGSKGREWRDLPSVVEEVWKRGPLFSLLRATGGAGAGFHAKPLENYKRKQRSLAKRTAASGPLSIFAPFGRAVDWYIDKVEMSEHIGRLAEFKGKQRELREKYPGMSQAEINERAAYSAREAADFATIGETMVHINHFIPFTNAAIQSLRGTYEKFHQNPHGAVGKWFLYAATPSVLAYVASQQGGYEEEYLELPDYQRDFFLNFKVAPNMWVRIPKPFELGVLGSGFERILISAIKQDTEQVDGWLGSVQRAAVPIEGWDQLMGPLRLLAELTTNHDFFRNRPIIPMHEASLHPDMREGRVNASRLGQGLQKLSGVDGRQWDHIIRSLFSDFGKVFTQASNIGREDRPFRWQDYVSVRGPVSASKSVRAVLEAAELYGESNSNQHVRTLRKMLGYYYDLEDDAERDALGKQIREYANVLKEFIPIWKENVRYVRDN